MTEKGELGDDKKRDLAGETELTDEDVIIGYEGKTVIGFTVLHVSKRLIKTA